MSKTTNMEKCQTPHVQTWICLIFDEHVMELHYMHAQQMESSQKPLKKYYKKHQHMLFIYHLFKII